MITRGAVDLSQWKSQDVSNLHNMSDVDSGQLAQHHTLGLGPNQAAAGNHNHGHIYGRLAVASQALTNGAWNIIGFTADEETVDYWTIDGNVIVVKAPGLYRLTCNAGFQSNTVGDRYVGITDSSSNILRQNGQGASPTAGFVSTVDLDCIIRFDLNTTISFAAYQNSGGPLNLIRDVGTTVFTYFSINRLAS